MSIKKVFFKNRNGESLAGRIDLPSDQQAHNFAIFAHCFTCTKNLTAISNISRELTQAGFGVLRFDFTGLGESEGDFSDTDFSGNVEDLVAASDFLEQNYAPPTLIVGHSLGGAAALLAAARINYIQAVVTIAAPAEPDHVKHLFQNSLDEIEKNGKAKVMLEGRPFTIGKNFVEDLLSHRLLEEVRKLRKPLLIFHSPQDKIVDITNAEKIYKAAFHPKSFVSLNGADHLLTNRNDSQYAGKVIAGWAGRYLEIPEEENVKSQSQVAASLDGTDMFTTTMKLGNHSFMADEPASFGGSNFGPSPYEYLSGALAACKAMTVQMYARRKQWEADNVTVHINHSRQHAADCEDCENNAAKIDTFHCQISLEGDLTEQQRNRLLEIADRCPVHKTLSSKIQIISNLSEKQK